MFLLNIKRENTNFGFYTFFIFGLFKIFIFVGNCIELSSVDYYGLFSLLFYLSIIGLCLRGFRYDHHRLVDVGTTILFIYSGVQGFIMLPGIISLNGNILTKLFILINFLLNLVTCVAFSLFITNWINYRESIGNIERIMLLIASILSLALFVISIIDNYSYISSNIIYAISFASYLSNVFFYLALSYSTYYLYK